MKHYKVRVGKSEKRILASNHYAALCVAYMGKGWQFQERKGSAFMFYALLKNAKKVPAEVSEV